MTTSTPMQDGGGLKTDGWWARNLAVRGQLALPRIRGHSSCACLSTPLQRQHCAAMMQANARGLALMPSVAAQRLAPRPQAAPVASRRRSFTRPQCRRSAMAAAALSEKGDRASGSADAYSAFETLLDTYDFKFRVGDKAWPRLDPRRPCCCHVLPAPGGCAPSPARLCQRPTRGRLWLRLPRARCRAPCSR